MNQDSLTIQDFSKRVDDYVKLRKRAQADLPRRNPGSSAADLKQYQASLAQEHSGTERSQAKGGRYFHSSGQPAFQKIDRDTFRERQGGKIRASLRHAEPVHGLSLAGQSTVSANCRRCNPRLQLFLSDLPKLPAEIEYRIVGRELVLLDTAANLIVDLLPDALPRSLSLNVEAMRIRVFIFLSC